MALDLTKTTYTYTVNTDGSITYSCACDGIRQNLSGYDISSKDSLESQLDQYTRSYISGLQSVAPEIGSDIQVGKPVTTTPDVEG